MEEIDKRQRSVDKMRIREADNARAEMAEHHQQNRYTLDVVEKRDARFLFDGMAADDEVGAAEAEDAPGQFSGARASVLRRCRLCHAVFSKSSMMRPPLITAYAEGATRSSP